ncbi:hypothetical protein CR162_05345 [Pseudoroseomonas rhizosphaerae]|uniref:Uncharacterized protein n=2 Tax=Teichococcus rhizosphaerae TaxID=1335062 RepID=A0A2C6Y5E6_9PROT|nr:hypothetical protein CR162_05345 [Pseudoroseomonas rhizosphaerae]
MFALYSSSILPAHAQGFTSYGPSGITTFRGDGFGGGTAYGPNGITTFRGDGFGGGTAYGPNGITTFRGQ